MTDAAKAAKKKADKKKANTKEVKRENQQKEENKYEDGKATTPTLTLVHLRRMTLLSGQKNREEQEACHREVKSHLEEAVLEQE